MPKIPNALALNREGWLQRALPILSAEVFVPAGLSVPGDVKVSCSFPGGGSARKRIGECWARQHSKAGVNEIFISPVIDEPVRVLDVLVHELVHAIDDCKNGHKKPFVQMARAVGLEGKPAHCSAGDRLRDQLKGIVERMEAYPHSTVLLSARKKQTTRLLKCECGECGCIWRMTGAWLDAAEHMGNDLACPVCHGGVIEVQGGAE